MNVSPLEYKKAVIRQAAMSFNANQKSIHAEANLCHCCYHHASSDVVEFDSESSGGVYIPIAVHRIHGGEVMSGILIDVSRGSITGDILGLISTIGVVTVPLGLVFLILASHAPICFQVAENRGSMTAAEMPLVSTILHSSLHDDGGRIAAFLR